MLVLKSILSLFLIRYVFAAPSIVSRQEAGADTSLIRLPSSLDEKTSENGKDVGSCHEAKFQVAAVLTDQSVRINEERGHPISEHNEISIKVRKSFI